jgi:hypothetical protein
MHLYLGLASPSNGYIGSEAGFKFTVRKVQKTDHCNCVASSNNRGKHSFPVRPPPSCMILYIHVLENHQFVHRL